MPREILIQIIKEKLILDYISIFFVYSLVNCINFKLSFQMLGINVKFKQIWIGILIINFYNTIGKQIIPLDLIYALILIIIYVILIKLIGKVHWVKAIWSSFLIFAISGIGVLFILSPVCSFNPIIYKFIMKTPPGIAVGTIFGEGICSIIAYFILKTMNISFVPPVNRRLDLIDLGNLYIFAVPFGFLYDASMRMLKDIGISPISDLIKGFFYQLFIAGSLPIVYYFVYTNTNKRHIEEIQKLQSEKDSMESTIKKLSKIKALNNAQSSERKTVIKPNEIKLRQLGLDSKNGMILVWIILDKTYLEIADLVHLSEPTIRGRVSGMLKKFSLKNREELAIFAIDNELVEIIEE